MLLLYNVTNSTYSVTDRIAPITSRNVCISIKSKRKKKCWKYRYNVFIIDIALYENSDLFLNKWVETYYSYVIFAYFNFLICPSL